MQNKFKYLMLLMAAIASFRRNTAVFPTSQFHFRILLFKKLEFEWAQEEILLYRQLLCSTKTIFSIVFV